MKPSTSPIEEQSSSRNSIPKPRQPHGARKNSLDSKSPSSYVSENREKELRKTYTLPKSKQKVDKYMSTAAERTKITTRRSDEESLSSIRSANDLEAKRKLKKGLKHTAYENKVKQSENKHRYAKSLSSCNSQSTNKESCHVKEKLIPTYTRSESERKLNKEHDLEQESVSSIHSERSLESTTRRKRDSKMQTDKRSTGVKSKTRGRQDRLVSKGDERRWAKISRKDILDRGRSPTPEMRTAGQSRRHHLDITTGSNNPLATGPDPRQTKVLSSMRYERKSYDPSRYSDAGDSLISSRSLASWSDRGP